jgi:translation initiation factor IF-3
LEELQDITKKLRINREIRASEVRVVGEKGEQLGIMPLDQARELAKIKSLDLVEVAATAVPPVCRLLDYGKYKYEQAKKEREAKKGQKIVEVREVRLTPKIGDHDFDAKARVARKLMIAGDKVKITIRFRGREITHPEIAWKLLQKMAENMKDIAVVEGQPVMEGRRMHVILAPAGTVVKPKAETKPEPKPKAEANPKTEKVKEEVK